MFSRFQISRTMIAALLVIVPPITDCVRPVGSAAEKADKIRA